MSKSKQGSYFKDSFLPGLNKTMGKLGQQRHLAAIRDAFATMIPLIIAGSMGMLLDAIVFGGGGSGYVSVFGLIIKCIHPHMSNADITALLTDGVSGWSKSSSVLALAFGSMNTVTVGLISLYFAFLFGYYIAVSRNFNNPVMAGLVSLASLILSALGNISFVEGAQGLIAAILITIISTEVFIKLSSARALLIKLPNGVPPAVSKSFAVFLPVLITMMMISVIDIVVFAPAVATHDLYVSTGANATFSGSTWTDLQTSILAFDPVKNGITASWWDSTLWSQLQTAVSDNKSFYTFINGLNDNQQHIVSSMVAIVSGNASIGDTAGAILSPDTKSTLSVVLTDNGAMVFSINIQKINIDYNGFGIAQAIFQFFTSWFIGLSTGKGGLGLALAYVTLVSIFWLFGIHGTNLLMGIFSPIFLMILSMNSSLVTSTGSYEAAKATGGMGIFASPFFDSFVFIGGAGSTLTLLVPTLIMSKRNELKEISKYAIPAGVFQINEPVMFGFPLVLNGMYAVPFIFTQIANVLIAWFFFNTGAVKMVTIQTPWTAPWLLGSVLSTIDGKAIIPAFINFGIDVAMYIPFILLDNVVYFKKLKVNNPEEYKIEMRYFNDPEYKFNYITNQKVSNLEEKADSYVINGKEVIKFWEKRISNEEKLNKIRTNVMTKANAKKEIALSKLGDLKTSRSQKADSLKEKWVIKKAKIDEKARLKKEKKSNK